MHSGIWVMCGLQVCGSNNIIYKKGSCSKFAYK
jgi:hypothetical protein